MTGKIRQLPGCAAGLLGVATCTAALETSFTGQFTSRAGQDWVNDHSLFFPTTGNSFWDGSAELRLMPLFHYGSQQLEIHYEAVLVKNDLLAANQANGLAGFLSGVRLPEDRRRVFDLGRTFDHSGPWQSYHRLDRLDYRYRGDWGFLSIGRDAITWGNGLVFNPMDLFNPFAPTDVERDYKIGDDLFLLDLYPAAWNGQMDWQLLVVPRRDAEGGTLMARESSFALKAHLMGTEAEWDFLAALHYDEPVLGLGHLGYLGNAVWRWDSTVTFPDQGPALFSTVANIDYSWTWSDRNFYGSLEFHYNTIGDSNYGKLPGNTALLDRLERGELHTVGRTYLAPSLQVELHPLLNFFIVSIVNLQDPSGILMPRLVWNARQNVEITLGGSLSTGGGGTEFGGISLPGSNRNLAYPERVYLWCKAYF